MELVIIKCTCTVIPRCMWRLYSGRNNTFGKCRNLCEIAWHFRQHLWFVRR